MQIFKNLFSKIFNFAKPVLAAAAPHGKATFSAAKPYLQEAEEGALKETSSRIGEAISKNFAAQEGSNVRKKRKLVKRSIEVKRFPKIYPINLPDFI